jgi:acyl carrier protein
MKNKIFSILSGLRPEYDFSKSVNFFEEGMLDSFDIVNLVNELESAFGISIPGTDILPENFSSVENIASLLKKLGVK